ncbi:Protein of unknown function [Gryllus bimaculatus]|nr:Protein of unknown function [Gryllus bimaculatus]
MAAGPSGAGGRRLLASLLQQLQMQRRGAALRFNRRFNVGAVMIISFTDPRRSLLASRFRSEAPMAGACVPIPSYVDHAWFLSTEDEATVEASGAVAAGALLINLCSDNDMLFGKHNFIQSN